MSSEDKPARRLSLAAVVIIALVGTPAVASAFDQNIINGVQHFIECWGYMWTDEPNHIKFCSPSNQAPFAGLPTDDGFHNAPVSSSSSIESSSSSSSSIESSSSSIESSSFSSSSTEFSTFSDA